MLMTPTKRFNDVAADLCVLSYLLLPLSLTTVPVMASSSSITLGHMHSNVDSVMTCNHFLRFIMKLKKLFVYTVNDIHISKHHKLFITLTFIIFIYLCPELQSFFPQDLVLMIQA